MPDTGAPWNIPFLDGTELVRAYPDFSEDLADAVAAGLTAAGNAGIGSNLINVTKTSSFATSSTTLVPWTDMTATITPSAADSRILLVVNAPAARCSAISTFGMQWFDGSAVVGNQLIHRVQETNREFATHLIAFDSPATTDPVTYSVQVRTSAGTLTIPNGAMYVVEVAA